MGMMQAGLLAFGSRAPITFIAAAQTKNGASGTSLVINKPTGTAQNDIMVAVMVSIAGGGGVTWTGDTSWNEILEQGAVPSLRIAWKVAGGSEGPNYMFTASASNNLGGSILTYRNAAYDAIGSVSTDSVNPITATAVTVAVANSLVLAVYSDRGASSSYSTPTGFAAVDANSDATVLSWAIFSKAVGSGSSGTVDSTNTGGSNFASILLSLKPA